MVYLREAKKEDVDILFEWANDKVVRENSFHSEPIPYNKHEEWFNKIIGRNDIKQYILMDDNIPVGQIRLNIVDNCAEISYSMSDSYRENGYGHKILRLIREFVMKEMPNVKRLIVKVKPDNVASNILFQRENYITKYTCYEYMLENTGEQGITD